MNKVCILMATFNGERFIETQIRSILNQTYSKFDLYINDDGSRDGTIKIIEKLATEDSRVHLLKLSDANNGQLYNFGKLMQYVSKLDYDYIMFSDQDDIWYDNKVKDTLSFMKKNESGASMVYTNYKENKANNTFRSAYNQDFPLNKHSILMFQNWIMGCTVMINKLLLSYSGQIPSEADNHDNWIMLVALTYGNVFYLNEVTMFHRVHDNNVTNNFSKSGILKKTYSFVNDVLHYKKFRLKKINLCKKVLAISSDRKTDFVYSFYKCLVEKNKIKRVIEAKNGNFRGLNIHETMKLFLMI